MATYDTAPAVLTNNHDGSYTYRWAIVQKPAEQAATTTPERATLPPQWTCSEAVIWQPVTRESIKRSVIRQLWDANDEQKLINDYNAAKEGVFGAVTSAESRTRIEAYKAFLSQRKELKDMIDRDCDTLGIS